MKYSSKIFVTVDVVLFRKIDNRLEVLLIQRLNEPFKDQWALPGGFVDEMEDFIVKNNVEIGIITTPKENAQEIADIYIRSGIKGIWNFAPIDLEVPSDVIVESVNLTESLFTLSYLMKERDEEQL